MPVIYKHILLDSSKIEGKHEPSDKRSRSRLTRDGEHGRLRRPRLDFLDDAFRAAVTVLIGHVQHECDASLRPNHWRDSLQRDHGLVEGGDRRVDLHELHKIADLEGRALLYLVCDFQSQGIGVIVRLSTS